jgi:hypothetical protein
MTTMHTTWQAPVMTLRNHPPAGGVAIKQAGVVSAEACVVHKHIYASVRPASTMQNHTRQP